MSHRSGLGCIYHFSMPFLALIKLSPGTSETREFIFSSLLMKAILFAGGNPPPLPLIPPKTISCFFFFQALFVLCFLISVSLCVSKFDLHFNGFRAKDRKWMGSSFHFLPFQDPFLSFSKALKSSYLFILYDLQERPLLLFTQMDGRESDW